MVKEKPLMICKNASNCNCKCPDKTPHYKDAYCGGVCINPNAKEPKCVVFIDKTKR